MEYKFVLLSVSKKAFALLSLASSFRKSIWHSGVAKGIIGRLPPTIPFCGFHLFQSGGRHFFRFNKAFGVPGIHFGPTAFRSPRREFLKPRMIIMCLLLAINPAVDLYLNRRLRSQVIHDLNTVICCT